MATVQNSVCTNAGKLLISSLTLANALLLFRKKVGLVVPLLFQVLILVCKRWY